MGIKVLKKQATVNIGVIGHVAHGKSSLDQNGLDHCFTFTPIAVEKDWEILKPSDFLPAFQTGITESRFPMEGHGGEFFP